MLVKPLLKGVVLEIIYRKRLEDVLRPCAISCRIKMHESCVIIDSHVFMNLSVVLL
jgi:hypothetical protein